MGPEHLAQAKGPWAHSATGLQAKGCWDGQINQLTGPATWACQMDRPSAAVGQMDRPVPGQMDRANGRTRPNGPDKRNHTCALGQMSRAKWAQAKRNQAKQALDELDLRRVQTIQNNIQCELIGCISWLEST